MKKLILGITLIVLGSIGLCSLGGCVSVPRGPVFTWSLLSPAHWEQHVVYPRCPGCPPQTNTVLCPALYGWKFVPN